MGCELSSEEELRTLLRLCAEHDDSTSVDPGIITAEQFATREMLRGRVLDAYIHDKPARLRQYGVITTYLMRGGDAVRAARICYGGEHERSVSEWCRDFLEFAVDWFARQKRRLERKTRNYQSALLACWNICERSGTSNNGNGGDVCATCPLREFS